MKTRKTYTRKQIVESINYWKKQLRAGNYKRLNENDHKWNPAIDKIVSSFQPKVHDIEGVPLAEFGTEDPVKLAEKLYDSIAEKNGLTGTRYVPGGYSHAGFDYHNYLDGDFKLYFNDQPTFTFRHMVLKKRDTEWIPDGNPYDGVCPKTVWKTMANSCAVTVKPGFKMADLKNVEKGMKAVSGYKGEFYIEDEDYPFYKLKWLFQVPQYSGYRRVAGKEFSNYLNFVAYEAGPFLTKKLQSLGTIAGEDLVEITARIVQMEGVSGAMKPKNGNHGQTLEQFKQARDHHYRTVLKPRLAQRKNAEAASQKLAELRDLIGRGATYEELFQREDFPNIVTAVISSSKKPHGGLLPTAHSYKSVFGGDDEDGFDADSYDEDFFEVMDGEIEELMQQDRPIDYEELEDGLIAALRYAQKNVPIENYIENDSGW